jgi:glucuronate isomerase
MEHGLVPDDHELVGGMVKNICYANAHRYYGMDVAAG